MSSSPCRDTHSVAKDLDYRGQLIVTGHIHHWCAQCTRGARKSDLRQNLCPIRPLVRRPCKQGVVMHHRDICCQRAVVRESQLMSHARGWQFGRWNQRRHQAAADQRRWRRWPACLHEGQLQSYRRWLGHLVLQTLQTLQTLRTCNVTLAFALPVARGIRRVPSCTASNWIMIGSYRHIAQRPPRGLQRKPAHMPFMHPAG